MKKKLLQLLFIISLAIIFNSCKRGANDPFLSLRSRNNRLIGTWELYKMDANSYHKQVYHYYDGTSVNERTCTYSFSDNIFNYVCVDEDGDSDSETISYSQTITINKDGTFVEKVTYDEGSIEYSGLWTWTDNVKNKIGIQLFTYIADWYKYDDDASSQFFYIDKLSEKELILKQEENSQSFDNNDNSNIYTYSATYIFHKKKD